MNSKFKVDYSWWLSGFVHYKTKSYMFWQLSVCFYAFLLYQIGKEASHLLFCCFCHLKIITKRCFIEGFWIRWWFFSFFFYCSGFCHSLTWISHEFTCILHPDPPSHLPLYPIPLGLPSAPGPSTCLMHPTKAMIFNGASCFQWCEPGPIL